MESRLGGLWPWPVAPPVARAPPRPCSRGGPRGPGPELEVTWLAGDRLPQFWEVYVEGRGGGGTSLCEFLGLGLWGRALWPGAGAGNGLASR